MRRLIIGLCFVAALSTPGASQAPQPAGVTVFEGARLIVGDGRAPVENSAFIVENNRFSQVGTRGQLKVPAGAARVDLDRQDRHAGDHRHAYAHVGDARGAHRSTAAEGILRSRRRHEPRPGYGRCRVPGPAGDHPGCRATSNRGTRHHRAGAGAHGGPLLDYQRSRGTKGRSGIGGEEGRFRQDLGGRSGRQVQEADAGAVRRGHRRGPQEQASRHGPPLYPRGCEGAAARGDRRVRSRRSGSGHRRRGSRPVQAEAESGPRARTFRVGESRWISAGSANRFQPPS